MVAFTPGWALFGARLTGRVKAKHKVSQGTRTPVSWVKVLGLLNFFQLLITVTYTLSPVSLATVTYCCFLSLLHCLRCFSHKVM